MTQPAPAGIAGLSVRELKPTGFKPVVVEYSTSGAEPVKGESSSP